MGTDNSTRVGTGRDRRQGTGRPRRGRVLALDLGQRRIGVAVSDSERRLATPLCVIERDDDGGEAALCTSVARVVEETGATQVVVGMPLSLSGRAGSAARRASDEVAVLRAGLDVAVSTADERLSTVTAARSLRQGGLDAKKARRRIDAVAASVLLQAWLDGRGGRGSDGGSDA